LTILANGHDIGHIHTSIGLQYVRTAPYGELIIENLRFARDILHTGWNHIALTFAGTHGQSNRHIRRARQNWTSFMAYDCIRLSMGSRP
ncbi:MAG: hypothetical protein M0Z50_13760, partial [Planctomycetia bacterium]|nr:hypothetical protein [Planctomycetia bacterium]